MSSLKHYCLKIFYFKIVFRENGYSLVALLISLTLHVMIASCVVPIADIAIKQNTLLVTRIALQSEMRYALECIVQDFTYAKKFDITDDTLTIITDLYIDKDRKEEKKTIYRIGNTKGICRLTCDFQPMTGESKMCNSTITGLTFKRISAKSIFIEICASDKDKKVFLKLHTVATALNISNENSL